jgi:5-methyltetrahydrofolate--homocysteine methyltransferase
MSDSEYITNIINAIVDGDEIQAPFYAKKALDSGLNYKVILNEGVIKACEEIGQLYEKEEYFLPDMLISGDALKATIDILKPIMEQNSEKSLGKILIGTVEGDVHDIGKSLVSSLLQGQGYDVIDLGTEVPPEKFAEKAKETNPDIIGLSGLLTVSISKMRETIALLKNKNIDSKIIIGGGVVSKAACVLIGADDCAKDGWEGVKKIKTLIKSKKGEVV